MISRRSGKPWGLLLGLITTLGLGCHCEPGPSADAGLPTDSGVALEGDGGASADAGSTADAGIWGACDDAEAFMCWDYAGSASEETRLVVAPGACAEGGGAWLGRCLDGQVATCTIPGAEDVRTYWRFYAGASLSAAPAVCAAGGGAWTTP